VADFRRLFIEEASSTISNHCNEEEVKMMLVKEKDRWKKL
jgi:hypothetical protein